MDSRRLGVTLLTYLDLVLRYIEGQAANDDLAVSWGSCSRASRGLDSGSVRLNGLLDTTDRCSFRLVATRGALSLLLAVNDGVERLI